MTNETETPSPQQEETETPTLQPEETDKLTPEKGEPEGLPEDTVTFKRSNLYIVLIIMYAVLVPLVLTAGLGAGYLIWGQDTGSSNANAAQPEPDDAQQAAVPVETDGQDTGSSNANAVQPEPDDAQQAAVPVETDRQDVPREITRYPSPSSNSVIMSARTAANGIKRCSHD
jgi:hypothetical protein